MSMTLYCPICNTRILYSNSLITRQDVLKCNGYLMTPKDELLEPMFVPTCEKCYTEIRHFMADMYEKKKDADKDFMDKIDGFLRKDEEK